ncbi:hypothetical protein HDA32_005278 [Spinactinospora alkalitolerans]|uniref:Polysaccharide pyruvyl transferase domain-containing protein n=1 Tax=Spinactinospora alkalitolerans TaxID=687207 RepID=A0A852U1R0_9ACTN|nr:polysaccharide pyruvyl transferase family protein [Spinactinospora alkalitolerans]NYE50158.1 hypothetical protein [Spinactinospora alkalitolerans]
MKRILIRSGKSPFDVVSPEAVMRQSIGGANLGNLVFSDSAYKMLLTPDVELVPTRGDRIRPDDAARINEEYDAVVLPFANAFRSQYERSLTTWTKVIERLRIPVVVLGIGAQSSLDYDLERLRPIDESVKEFAKAVLDRSPSIGVRGEFTGHYLDSLGFKDVEVIGCPSMFRYGGELNVEKKASALGRDSRIAVSVTRDAGDIEKIVMANFDRYPELVYFAQDHRELELLYWGDTSEAADRHAEFPQHRSHPLFRDGRVRLHLDPVTWIRSLSEYDFAFGTRIHGTITALLGGTPGMVLCHDSRTLELSRYFEIPYKKTTELSADVDAAALYEEADYTALLKGHGERLDTMTGFLESHGLDHVYAAGGDGGASFEEGMRGLDFAPPIRAWDGEDDGGLGYRLGWLKENAAELKRTQTRADKHIDALTKRNKALEDALAKQGKTLEKAVKRITALERTARNTPYRRVRRTVGRPVRRILKGRE